MKKNRTRITLVATSDLHGHLDGIEEVCRENKADIVVISGDIQPANIYINPKEWFGGDFVQLLEKLNLLEVEVVAIEGNHDFWLSGQTNDSLQEIGFPGNFHLLRDSGIELKGLSFYGTPWVPWINGRWCYEESDEDNRDRYMAMPLQTDVLVTHTPPLIPAAQIDISTEYDERYWQHFGSGSLNEAIVHKGPKLNFCGHIHSGDHRPCKIETQQGNCFCFNVSRINERYHVEYPFRIVGIEKGQNFKFSLKCKSQKSRSQK